MPEEFKTPELCDLAVQQDSSYFAMQYVLEALRTPELIILVDPRILELLNAESGGLDVKAIADAYGIDVAIKFDNPMIDWNSIR